MATGLRREPNIHDRNIASSAGIRPYKLDLSYASVTTFLADKKLKGYNSASAEAGDWFYSSLDGTLMVYNGVTSVWDRHQSVGNRKFFRWVPKGGVVACGKGASAALTTTGVNVWSTDVGIIDAYQVGTQTKTVPLADATTGYLDLGSQDQTSGDGCTLTPEFAGTSAKMAFTTGTSAAFYTKATFNLSDVSQATNVMVGFKIQAAAAALSGNLPNYTEQAFIGITGTGAAIKITTQKASSAVTTDTTQTATDATDLTLGVYCSAAGVWTYTVNGSAPTVTAALTATAASVVVPCIVFEMGASTYTTCLLKSWEAGFQVGAE